MSIHYNVICYSVKCYVLSVLIWCLNFKYTKCHHPLKGRHIAHLALLRTVEITLATHLHVNCLTSRVINMLSLVF